MKVLKIFLIASLISVLQQCSLLKPKEVIVIEYVEKPSLNLNYSNSILAENVFFEVHSDENDQERQLVCTGAKDFENLSLNMKSMLNYIFIQREIIKSYKKYYESKTSEGVKDELHN